MCEALTRVIRKKKEKKEWKKQRNREKFETTRDDVSSIRSRKLFFLVVEDWTKKKKGTVIRIHACKEREGLEQQNDARIACQSGSEQT